MNNLFASFSPQGVFSLPWNWISLVIPAILLVTSPWLSNNTSSLAMKKVFSWVKSELSPLINSSSLNSMLLVSMSLFWVIISMNISGLVPFIFTPSGHPSINLSFALPLWVGHMMLSIFKQPLSCASHLVPSGAPAALLPALVIIELISSVIRPITLTVRLTANMIAGHLLLTLVGSGTTSVLSAMGLVVMVSSIALMVLESAVACIQAYVFTVLSTLYLEEVNSPMIS